MTESSNNLTSLASNGVPTEESVLSVLQQRQRADLPYTRLSSTNLVVLNPLRTLSNLNDASAEDYRKQTYADAQWEQHRKEHPEEALPPHPYELAARVYHAMRRTGQSQALVFNGATESGKTFTSNLLTSQLLRLSSSADRQELRLAQQVRSLDTLLTSFGSAKTQMNSNASRFSRHLELHFNSQGRLGAAKVLTFGLDKSRLVKLPREERSYHVFYQLLAGATQEERQDLKLQDVTSYALLSSSGCFRLPSGPSNDDHIAMDELRAALKALGFKSKQITSVFRVLSTVLLLGNIEFDDHNGHDATSEAAHIANPHVLEDVAELLGVSAEELTQVLTNRSRFVRHELVSSLLDAEAAGTQRDSLMQGLYATLFAFVVETANHQLAPSSEDEYPMQIVQLDLPGHQTRSSDGAVSSSVPGRYQDFVFNSSAEGLQNWLSYQAFDETVGRLAEMREDNIPLPDVSPRDNAPCVELLRGATTAFDGRDSKPAGLLGALEAAVQRVQGGQVKSDDDATLLEHFDAFASYPSYLSSKIQSTPGRYFGIHHSQGPSTYAIDGFLASELDLFDSAFVPMLCRSRVSFVARLFSGPSLSIERHPMDPNTIVGAQVTARPLRQFSSLSALAHVDQTLDPTQIYGYSRQVDAALSEALAAISYTAQLWSVSCIRPNDISQPGSFDARRVSTQVKALLLPELAAQKRYEYVQSFSHEDFCNRYRFWVSQAASAVGVSEPREQIQAFVIANAWRESTDYAVGDRKIWLAYGPWRRMEDRLRADEPREPSSAVSSTVPSDSQFPSDSTGSSNSPSEQAPELRSSPLRSYDGLGAVSHDGLLYRAGSQPSFAASNPFSLHQAGIDAPTLHNNDSVSAWGGEWDQRAYGDVAPALGEKDGQGVVRGIDAVEEVSTTATRRWWVRFTWLCTWWIPSYLLSRCGGMKRPDVQMAWREKVTICGLIFFSCAFILFYILFFGKILCPDANRAWDPQELSEHTGTTDYYAAIAGNVYDFTRFYKIQHSDVSTVQVDSDTMLELAGLDLSPYFPVPMTLACPDLVTSDTFTLDVNTNLTATITQAVHTSGSLSTYSNSALDNSDWYTATLQPALKKYWKGYYVYNSSYLSEESSWRTWATIDGNVYDLTNYFETVDTATTGTLDGQNVDFLDSTISQLFQANPGTDITSDYNAAIKGLNSTYAAAQRNCLDNAFCVGKADFRKTARCQTQNYLLLAFSILLVVTIGAKFLAALQLTTKRAPEQQNKFVICQVPCYTEGEEELRKTIDSIAGQKYDDKRKLIFIICDGMIVGSGNETPTPRIVLDILGVDPKLDPEPLMFKSIADGSRQLNYGKVYSGLYEYEGHVVPYIVVVKVGRPSERSRPGNRGKRDTQILMMRYLNRVHFDAPMCPLELEIYHQMKNVIGIDPAFYEFILMVDADTSVEPDGLNRLVAVAADDERIIALCGETSLDNEEGSWWTMIQVYEYYISHHLSKAFESLFGSVTCLPGCFSMYRVRSADKGRPLFIANRIIDDFSENRVDTLHKKNLFSLGEDRYLTTLILKHFPSFRTKFTQDAKAHTAAPDRFDVLLSQRRRWINSTIHNLAELMLMPELCGFCLFSMRFIVFIDLLGTIILPATVIYLIYLIVEVATGAGQFPLISLVMIGAVYGLQVVIFLLKRQWQYIGWLVIYILAYPIYSFFLPVYSFWHMDDFSWGNTRIVVGEKGNKKIIAGTDDEPYDDSMIPLKKFSEYQRQIWGEGGPIKVGTAGGDMALIDAGLGAQYPSMASLNYLQQSPQNPFIGTPGSMHKSPSYQGSVAGSDYGGAATPGGRKRMTTAGSADYFQSTNLLEKAAPPRSRESSYMSLGLIGNSNNYRSSSYNNRPSASRVSSMQFGAGGGGGGGAMNTPMPSTMSMWGMAPMPMSTPNSMYGLPTTPSMYGLPTTPSMYGMLPPAAMGAPQYSPDQMGGYQRPASQHRSSMMPLGSQYTGGGAFGASQSRMSTLSLGQGLLPPTNPFATTTQYGSPPAPSPGYDVSNPSNDPSPSEQALVDVMVRYLGSQTDLYSVTKRMVRKAVEDAFPRANLIERKAEVNALMDKVLAGQI